MVRGLPSEFPWWGCILGSPWEQTTKYYGFTDCPVFPCVPAWLLLVKTFINGTILTLTLRRYDMSTSLPLTKWPPNFSMILICYLFSASEV